MVTSQSYTHPHPLNLESDFRVNFEKYLEQYSYKDLLLIKTSNGISKTHLKVKHLGTQNGRSGACYSYEIIETYKVIEYDSSLTSCYNHTGDINTPGYKDPATMLYYDNENINKMLFVDFINCIINKTHVVKYKSEIKFKEYKESEFFNVYKAETDRSATKSRDFYGYRHPTINWSICESWSQLNGYEGRGYITKNISEYNLKNKYPDYKRIKILNTDLYENTQKYYGNWGDNGFYEWFTKEGTYVVEYL